VSYSLLRNPLSFNQFLSRLISNTVRLFLSAHPPYAVPFFPFGLPIPSPSWCLLVFRAKPGRGFRGLKYRCLCGGAFFARASRRTDGGMGPNCRDPVSNDGERMSRWSWAMRFTIIFFARRGPMRKPPVSLFLKKKKKKKKNKASSLSCAQHWKDEVLFL